MAVRRKKPSTTAKMNKLKLTVGEIVHYWIINWTGQPEYGEMMKLPAIILKINDDNTINLAVINQYAQITFKGNVKLSEEDEPKNGHWSPIRRSN